MQTKPQMSASDRILYWLEEARELHDMATHREREAELILMTGPGPSTNAFVKHMRVLAHQLDEVAQYADQQAKEAEAEISAEELRQLHFVGGRETVTHRDWTTAGPLHRGRVPRPREPPSGCIERLLTHHHHRGKTENRLAKNTTYR